MSEKTLSCRYCKGDHLSLKCPTRKKNTILNKVNLPNKNTSKFIKKEKLMVKFSCLPNDIYKKELVDLLKQWGPIGKVFLKKDYKTKLTNATVEFINKENGLKAVYQLDNTPFDTLIIRVEELTTKNYH